MIAPTFLYRSILKLFPRASVEVKSGTVRESLPLEPKPESDGSVLYAHPKVELRVRTTEDSGGTRWSLRLRNLQDRSLRVTRLRLPAWNGLDDLLSGFDPSRVSFLRNGYQSWSTVRSYRMSEKPLRPRLRLVSLVTSNLANLPSNSPGVLSSEMYTVVTDLDSDQSVLVGQCEPFDQFLYIILNLIPGQPKRSYFELIFDFGRKVLEPNAVLDLDGLYFASGPSTRILDDYFKHVGRAMGYVRPQRAPSGWCSWYEYLDRIDPELLLSNLASLKQSGVALDFFQVDDGWQAAVGDWLHLKPAFKGRMRELSDAIRAAGLRPGLWFAPFAVSRGSRLFKEHPEYLIRDEFGRPLPAGYNPIWKGLYYGLDATHPRFREYLSEVVDTIVHDWGFDLLKCDFLFAACLRGGNHHEIGLSRAEILKSGMRLLRERAGQSAFLMGCGMPLSAGIGLVDAMRVGPDTGDFWMRLEGKLLRTGAMVGLRNSLRATLVRAPMHGALWINDPDCAIVRRTNTRLSEDERMAQLRAIAISGGLVTISDQWSRFGGEEFRELERLLEVSRACYPGQASALDLMDRELPEQFHNDSGFIAFFNWDRAAKAKRYDLRRLKARESRMVALVDEWKGERISPVPDTLDLGPMPARGSRLFKIERA